MFLEIMGTNKGLLAYIFMLAFLFFMTVPKEDYYLSTEYLHQNLYVSSFCSIYKYFCWAWKQISDL